MKVDNDNKHAVLAIDPGGTSGVAAGYVQLGSTFKETVKTLEHNKAIEVKGEWLDQAVQLAHIMDRFVFTANVENLVPLDNIHIVVEDFVLRRRQQGGATGNLTSIWVAAAAVAMHLNVAPWDGAPMLAERANVEWQQASQAKGFATNERLKMWGLWEVGSEHKRDAWRHWAVKVNKLVA